MKDGLSPPPAAGLNLYFSIILKENFYRRKHPRLAFWRDSVFTIIFKLDAKNSVIKRSTIVTILLTSLKAMDYE